VVTLQSKPVHTAQALGKYIGSLLEPLYAAKGLSKDQFKAVARRAAEKASVARFLHTCLSPSGRDLHFDCMAGALGCMESRCTTFLAEVVAGCLQVAATATCKPGESFLTESRREKVIQASLPSKLLSIRL
jgi:hypothetical protein